MSILKSDFLRLRLIPQLAYFIIKILSKSIYIKRINRERVDELLKNGSKIIFAFWHQRQFLLVDAHKKLKIALMTSMSKDGDIQTQILTKFGYYCIRGSSSKGGVSALKSMVRVINNGYNVAIAVDGPRGPIYEVKDGIIFMAKMTGAVIIPVSSSAKSFVFKKAWDKYMLPFPFTKAVIIYGQAIKVGRDDDISIKRDEIKRNIDQLTQLADKEIGFMVK